MGVLPHHFASFITAAEADQDIAGCIILAAAPCTAMVFAWSHLTKGDAAYKLVQVAVNDLVMLVLFVPIVQFRVSGASSLTVPFQVFLYLNARLGIGGGVATVVGVLVEVSVMLSVWAVCNRTRHWFPAEKSNIFQIPSA